ncbi:MAG: ABC transporter ATP-binding protein [Candidatus Kerfeldbacteria bacterium]|nr:ABC transporter ATP-binding protein [Candidatus Kerfeldbacteria bacterium]
MENVIVATKLSKSFDAGKPSEVQAVQNVDLTVGAGEIVLIMGPSGSGKTTLVTMLGGLLKPTDGTVTVRGTIISTLPESTLPLFRRKHFGFIFQSFQLLESLSALENVEALYRLAGLSRHDSRDRAAVALKNLGLEKRLHAYPRALSGGEKQRVAIARAMANNPAVLFADEPTANLDSKSGHDVMRLLCETACREKRAVVIVSHDERLKDVAMRVLWMEDGGLFREAPGGHDQWCRMPHEHR